MTAAQLYSNTLHTVSTLTGIQPEEILHSKTEAATNARHLLIHTLTTHLPDCQIATLLGITRQAANKARNQFENRCRIRWELNQLYTELQNFLED